MQYYKIIGNNFGHFNYKLGLNSLSDNGETFDPNVKCGPGGLYFCDITHIFEYLEYGDKVCTIELPEDAQVVKVENKYKSDKIIITSIQDVLSADMFKNLIDLGANIHLNNDRALRCASNRGHVEVVRALLENGANVHAQDDYALRWASRNGHVEVVKVLLENGANVHADDDGALRLACEFGHTEIVKVLLKHGANVHARNDFPIRIAAYIGNVYSADDYALRWAFFKNGHTKIVKVLLEYGANIDACNE